jgi:hypothetical protein
MTKHVVEMVQDPIQKLVYSAACFFLGLVYHSLKDLPLHVVVHNK